MNMQPKLICALSVCAVLILPIPVRADLEIVFDGRISITPPPDSGEAPSTEDNVIAIRLGQNRCHLHEDGDLSTVYDFDAKRVFEIVESGSEYTDSSLYAWIGFRASELQNRAYLNQYLNELGVESNILPLVMSEHELSVSLPDTASEIQQSDHTDKTAYTASGKELLSLSKSRSAIPDSYRQAFVRCFRHKFGGHPSIIGNLVSSSGVADQITISQFSAGEHVTDLRLVSAEEVLPERGFLGGLEPVSGSEPSLQELISSLDDSSAVTREQRVSELTAKAKDSVADGDYLTGFLAVQEAASIEGIADPPWSESERSGLLESEQALKLIQALAPPSDQADAEAKIEVLISLKNSIDGDSYLLNVYEANLRNALNDVETAKNLMFEALQENPLMVSAWYDLGGFYFKEFRTRDAWLCWNTARVINPDHPMLDSVDNMEQTLAAQFPGLF